MLYREENHRFFNATRGVAGKKIKGGSISYTQENPVRFLPFRIPSLPSHTPTHSRHRGGFYRGGETHFLRHKDALPHHLGHVFRPLPLVSLLLLLPSEGVEDDGGRWKNR